MIPAFPLLRVRQDVLLPLLVKWNVLLPLRDAKAPAIVTQDLEVLLDHLALQDPQHVRPLVKWDQEAHLVS